MKGLLMISGGFDSAVVAKLLLDQGIELTAVHFSFEPFTDDSPEKKSRNVCDILNIQLKVINVSEQLKKISSECSHKYYFVLAKRLMHRLAEQEAISQGCNFLVNGENIGQVGSQTIENLRVIDNAVKIHILRPVLCWNKEEIINKSKEFGFYEICCGPEMCDVLGPKSPATKSKIKFIEYEESKCKSI